MRSGYRLLKIGRMTQAWWNTSGGTTSFAGYRYDDLGRRSWAGMASAQTSYAYDSVSRMSSLAQSFAGRAGPDSFGGDGGGDDDSAHGEDGPYGDPGPSGRPTIVGHLRNII
jgi:hypothetical protein